MCNSQAPSHDFALLTNSLSDAFSATLQYRYTCQEGSFDAPMTLTKTHWHWYVALSSLPEAASKQANCTTCQSGEAKSSSHSELSTAHMICRAGRLLFAMELVSCLSQKYVTQQSYIVAMSCTLSSGQHCCAFAHKEEFVEKLMQLSSPRQGER